LQHIIPPFRFTIYAIGLYLGFVLRKCKNTKVTSRQLQLGWFAAILSLSITIGICISSQDYSPLTAACFGALAPIFWGFFFAWVIFAAQLGHKS
jgi:dolichyl-phosphate-mannose--protein O-mannosyl transferase